MYKYFQTTTLILIWCLVLSILWSLFVYWRFVRRSQSQPALQATDPVNSPLIPALVIGPLFLVLFFRFLGWNLLFPINLFASPMQQIFCGLIPALVLLLASGLGQSLNAQICREYSHWRAKAFARVALAVGRSPATDLRFLVIVRSLSSCWAQCLPWVFGEIIVVEAIFNAPGLGLDAWHLARVRNLPGLIEALSWTLLLYGICTGLAFLINRWLGSRLEGYQ